MTRALPLVRIWAAVMTLTAAAMVIGHVHGAERLKVWEIGLLLALTLLKAGLVLRHYLELKRESAWHGALMLAMALLLGGIFVLALVG